VGEEKSKTRKVEWSFSFENIGENISKAFESIGFSGDTEVKTGNFVEAVGTAKSARVKLDMSIGDASVEALPAGSSNLLEADVTYLGEVELAVRSDGDKKTVRLGQIEKGGVVLKSIKEFFSSRKLDLRWDVRLTPDIPLELDINTGITSNRINLNGLQLSGLRVNSGTGKTVMVLPRIENQYDVACHGGTGEFNVEIPANSNIDLKLSNGTGATNLTIGEGSAVEGNISGGLGSSTIYVPSGAAVRIKASTGLGSIDVPKHFVRVKGGNDFISTSGAWQTPDYDSAERKITLKYSGGVGKLTVISGAPIV